MSSQITLYAISSLERKVKQQEIASRLRDTATGTVVNKVTSKKKSKQRKSTGAICCSNWISGAILTEKSKSAQIIPANLQSLSSSSAATPAGTPHMDSADPLPWALPFLVSRNERRPGKQKTHFFCAACSLITVTEQSREKMSPKTCLIHLRGVKRDRRRTRMMLISIQSKRITN